MNPMLRGMTIPVIKSLGHFLSASFLKAAKFTSLNDREVLMTADNSAMVWATTKQLI